MTTARLIEAALEIGRGDGLDGVVQSEADNQWRLCRSREWQQGDENKRTQ
jgi:hypothetical protein